MKEYTFTYYGWIPGYNDFDQDWITVSATSEEEAREKLKEYKHLRYAKGEPVLESVEDCKVA